jgi:phage shock protein A
MMGVLDRISMLLRANINDMLDQAEDPEIMLNQILRDMEGEINKARGQVADMMAQEKIYSDDLQAAQSNSAHMEERAEYYVRQGNDTMAKEALKRKADADANVAVLQGQLQAQSELVSHLKSQLDALQAKYQDAMANRDKLIAQVHAARAQQQVAATMQNLNVNDYSSDLGRMEQRIRMESARAQSQIQLATEGSGGDDIASRFDAAEQNNKIDQDLAALKARMGMSDAAPEAGAPGTSGQ